MTANSVAITDLLHRISSGDRQAANDLFEGLYSALRSMAGSAMKDAKPGDTLQPTALVHEVFAKLMKGSTLANLNDRRSFYAVVAMTMRSILVDHARKRSKARRLREHRMVLDDLVDGFETESRVDLLALDEALHQLQCRDERQHQIVTLHFFGGLRFNEIAQHLEVSVSTVERDWRFARCWLLDRLEGGR
jgi:RNA polymerase sigma factor (TIGR02999 family)